MTLRLFYLLFISLFIVSGCQTTKSTVDIIKENIDNAKASIADYKLNQLNELQEFANLQWQLGFNANPTMFQKTNTDYLNDREILILKTNLDQFEIYSKEIINMWKNAFPPTFQTAVYNNDYELYFTESQLYIELILKKITKADAVRKFSNAIMKRNNNLQSIYENINQQIRADRRRRQLGLANALSEFSKTIGDMNKTPKSTTTNCVTFPGGANCTTW
jgi:hypothetical protein